MNRILLDTSVIIDFLRQKDKRQTLLLSLVKQKYQPSISIVSHAELFSGRSIWETKRARLELEHLFSQMQILLLTEEISKKGGELRAKYSLDLLDALIAATALAHDLELSTLNRRDFEPIKNLRLISEDSLLS